MNFFNLLFQGYCSHFNCAALPTFGGIYLVYRGYPTSPGEVKINELLYVGQAENINARIKNHEKLPEFMSCLKVGEQIYYSCAKVDSSNLDRVENALICTQHPPVNELLQDYFNYDATTVNVSGDAKFIRDASLSTRDKTPIIIQTI